jgi:GH18 family chitinase
MTVIVHCKYTQPLVIGCYFTNWSQHRQGFAYFTPSNIDPSLCTHLYYAFANIDLKTRSPSPFEENDIESPMGMYEEFNRLKLKNRRMKTLLSLGGASVDSTQFQMAFGPSQIRREFIRNTIKYLRKYQFDGLDVDWEFPITETDRQIFSSLVRDYRLEFDNEAIRFNRTRLLLTAAVAAYQPKIEAGYDIKEIVPFLDYINLMTYDYHGSFIFI